jgi:hypothetical protein
MGGRCSVGRIKGRRLEMHGTPKRANEGEKKRTFRFLQTSQALQTLARTALAGL